MADDTNTDPEAVDETAAVSGDASGSEPGAEPQPAPEADPPADAAPPAAEAEAPAPKKRAPRKTAAAKATEGEDSPSEGADAEAPASPEAAAEPAPRKRGPRPKPMKKAAPKERGTYVREPREPVVEGRRKERRGIVVSSACDKTITVRIDSAKPHPKYHKIVRRSMKLHAHDEANTAHVGDVVRVVETRPLSKTKRWRLVEIVKAAR